MARLHGSSAKRDLAGLRQIRDHLLQVDVDLTLCQTCNQKHGGATTGAGQAVEAKLQADGLSALAETLKVLSGHEDRAMLEPFQALRG